MQNNYFKEIEKMHFQWSMSGKVAKLAYLRGQWQRLNQIAIQIGNYFKAKGSITQEERHKALQLIEMIDSAETEGVKTEKELAEEWKKELVKILIQ